MTDDLLDTYEIEAGKHVEAAVIWMHGLGADGHDFAPIVPELTPLPRATRFVFPHAPVQPITLNGGMEMRAWFDVTGFDRNAHQDEAGIRASQAAIGRLVQREIDRGIDSRRIILAGFSQGGAIALQTALRHPLPLGGVMALSTWLTLHDSLAAEASDVNRDIALLMAHGRQDTVIELAVAEQSRDRLAAAGYQVAWHDYPMAHSVCPQEVADISAFLNRALA